MYTLLHLYNIMFPCSSDSPCLGVTSEIDSLGKRIDGEHDLENEVQRIVNAQHHTELGGGFKHFLFFPVPGEMIHFETTMKPPTRETFLFDFDGRFGTSMPRSAVEVRTSMRFNGSLQVCQFYRALPCPLLTLE